MENYAQDRAWYQRECCTKRALRSRTSPRWLRGDSEYSARHHTLQQCLTRLCKSQDLRKTVLLLEQPSLLPIEISISIKISIIVQDILQRNGNDPQPVSNVSIHFFISVQSKNRTQGTKETVPELNTGNKSQLSKTMFRIYIPHLQSVFHPTITCMIHFSSLANNCRTYKCIFK